MPDVIARDARTYEKTLLHPGHTLSALTILYGICMCPEKACSVATPWCVEVFELLDIWTA